MKSFEPVYAILSVYIPVSVSAAFMPLAALLLNSLVGPLPLLFWFAFGLCGAIGASVYYGLIKKSKADHSAADIRGAIVTAILAYGLGSLFGANSAAASFSMKFFPSLYNIPSALAALLVWFPVVKIKKIFRGQEIFETNVRLYEGERLRQQMLEDSGLMSEADADIKKLRTYYCFSFLPSFILMIAAGAMRLRFSVPLTALLGLLFFAGICVAAFLEFLRREYAFASEGLNLPNRPRALSAAFFTIALAAGGGLLLSSNSSLLSPSLIMDLLRRIMAFFERLAKPAAAMPPVVTPPPQMQRPGPALPPELLEMARNTGPSPFWDWLKYAGIVTAAILFIWFMISPLLRRSKLFRGMGALPRKIAAFLKEWFKTLLDGAAYFFSSFKEGKGKRLAPSAEDLRRLEDDILGGYSSAKRRELRRSITLFARLIYWGQEILHAAWKPSYAPAEYCALLAAELEKSSAAQTAADVIKTGALFEKALYSAFPLSKEEYDEFKTLAEQITSTEPRRQ